MKPKIGAQKKKVSIANDYTSIASISAAVSGEYLYFAGSSENSMVDRLGAVAGVEDAGRVEGGATFFTKLGGVSGWMP